MQYSIYASTRSSATGHDTAHRGVPCSRAVCAPSALVCGVFSALLCRAVRCRPAASSQFISNSRAHCNFVNVPCALEIEHTVCTACVGASAAFQSIALRCNGLPARQLIRTLNVCVCVCVSLCLCLSSGFSPQPQKQSTALIAQQICAHNRPRYAYLHIRREATGGEFYCRTHSRAHCNALRHSAHNSIQYSTVQCMCCALRLCTRILYARARA